MAYLGYEGKACGLDSNDNNADEKMCLNITLFLLKTKTQNNCASSSKLTFEALFFTKNIYYDVFQYKETKCFSGNKNRIRNFYCIKLSNLCV